MTDLSGWIQTIIGSAVFLLLYTGISFWWDLHKYNALLQRLRSVEDKIDKLSKARLRK